jgi:uncharacterized HAD superfamily protein
MNIGIDFDGVIADTSILKIKYVKDKFKIKIAIKDSSKEKLSKIIGKEEYAKMIIQTYPSKEMENVPAIKGSIETLKKLNKNNKIFIITSRTNSEVLTAKKWLKNNKITYTQIINTSNKSKSEVCKKYKIEAFIEDDLDKLIEIKNNKMKKILLKRPYNLIKPKNKEITLCKNWQEILKVLK